MTDIEQASQITKAPRDVKLAVAFLYAYAAIHVLSFFVNLDQKTDLELIVLIFLFNVAWILMIAGLAHLINKGRNWARTTVFVIALLQINVLLAVLRDFHGDLGCYLIIVEIMPFFLATVILFFPQSSRWFKQCKKRIR